MPPRSLTACSFLPPEGAAAPAVWQSQSRGPYWWGRIVLAQTSEINAPSIQEAAAPAVTGQQG